MDISAQTSEELSRVNICIVQRRNCLKSVVMRFGSPNNRFTFQIFNKKNEINHITKNGTY
jgi:hypothetical protein